MLPGSGGAIWVTGGSPTITGCTFSENTATYDGGAISCRGGGDVLIENCLFSENEADDFGGGVSVFDTAVSIIASTFI